MNEVGKAQPSGLTLKRYEKFDGYVVIWPDCFITGIVPDDRVDDLLCADALWAWGNVMSGSAKDRPACFESVMLKIARRLGVEPTVDALMDKSKRLTREAETDKGQ